MCACGRPVPSSFNERAGGRKSPLQTKALLGEHCQLWKQMLLPLEVGANNGGKGASPPGKETGPKFFIQVFDTPGRSGVEGGWKGTCMKLQSSFVPFGRYKRAVGSQILPFPASLAFLLPASAEICIRRRSVREREEEERPHSRCRRGSSSGRRRRRRPRRRRAGRAGPADTRSR